MITINMNEIIITKIKMIKAIINKVNMDKLINE